MKEKFADALENRVLLFDGAMELKFKDMIQNLKIFQMVKMDSMMDYLCPNLIG